MPTTPDQGLLRRYAELVRAIGPGFHPDTPAADYLSLPAGWSADSADELVDAVFGLDVDPYELALRALGVI